MANSTTRENSAKRNIIENSGCRYVDEELAFHDPVKPYPDPWVDGDYWYDGFMSSDGLHPTVNGAKALAMQFLKDIPEIMQYTKIGSGDAAPDYDGGDH
jgi:lysophospholipase L1-like esterase